jgi:hypothetical protein
MMNRLSDEHDFSVYDGIAEQLLADHDPKEVVSRCWNTATKTRWMNPSTMIWIPSTRA